MLLPQPDALSLSSSMIMACTTSSLWLHPMALSFHVAACARDPSRARLTWLARTRSCTATVGERARPSLHGDWLRLCCRSHAIGDDCTDELLILSLGRLAARDACGQDRHPRDLKCIHPQHPQVKWYDGICEGVSQRPEAPSSKETWQCGGTSLGEGGAEWPTLDRLGQKAEGCHT